MKKKERNNEGKELLQWLIEVGLGILIEANAGDKERAFTYIGPRRSNIITGAAEMEWQRKMEVKEKIRSDHMPITCECGAKKKE